MGLAIGPIVGSNLDTLSHSCAGASAAKKKAPWLTPRGHESFPYGRVLARRRKNLLDGCLAKADLRRDLSDAHPLVGAKPQHLRPDFRGD